MTVTSPLFVLQNVDMKHHTGKCALILLSGGILLSACLGGNGTPAAPGMSTPVLNTIAVTEDEPLVLTRRAA